MNIPCSIKSNGRESMAQSLDTSTLGHKELVVWAKFNLSKAFSLPPPLSVCLSVCVSVCLPRKPQTSKVVPKNYNCLHTMAKGIKIWMLVLRNATTDRKRKWPRWCIFARFRCRRPSNWISTQHTHTHSLPWWWCSKLTNLITSDPQNPQRGIRAPRPRPPSSMLPWIYLKRLIACRRNKRC